LSLDEIHLDFTGHGLLHDEILFNASHQAYHENVHHVHHVHHFYRVYRVYHVFHVCHVCHDFHVRPHAFSPHVYHDVHAFHHDHDDDLISLLPHVYVNLLILVSLSSLCFLALTMALIQLWMLILIHLYLSFKDESRLEIQKEFPHLML